MTGGVKIRTQSASAFELAAGGGLPDATPGVISSGTLSSIGLRRLSFRPGESIMEDAAGAGAGVEGVAGAWPSRIWMSFRISSGGRSSRSSASKRVGGAGGRVGL